MRYLNEYKDKTILVTGGAGAIGSNLVKKLSELEAKMIIILDDFSSAKKWNIPSLANVMLVEGDILNEEYLKRVFFERPEYIFHLAAFFANQNSIDYPEKDLAVNGMGTLKLLRYAQLTGIKRFVYASSGCSIYGSEAPLPLTENFMSMKLSTPYQITKMLGELYSNFFNHQYGLEVVKARFFNSYGPGEIPGQYRNVIPNFIYWAMKGMPLPITGTGEETRDFTYVGDIVDGLLRVAIMEEAIGEEFNLAAGKEIQIGQLATMINELTNNKAGIKYTARRKWDNKSRILASIEKANTLIGYNPNTEFENGINQTINWFKNKWDNIEKAAKFEPGMSSAVRDGKADK
ncbi:MAG: NAD-dependent epimerase/dehydratase family protein [bacterium]|nr:NAD-dependent epimerase/dehydratase family protein [bacterium]